jgi:hypothetical protein
MLRFVLQGDYVDVRKKDDFADFLTLAPRTQFAF